MSSALSYLIKARPEAMTAYFTFLKDRGYLMSVNTRRLDLRNATQPTEHKGETI